MTQWQVDLRQVDVRQVDIRQVDTPPLELLKMKQFNQLIQPKIRLLKLKACHFENIRQPRVHLNRLSINENEIVSRNIPKRANVG